MLLYGDRDTVSVSTGTEKPLHLAPSVASVITAEDIRATGATTLDEALESVPGLHVSLSFNRLNSKYSIRGIHTSQTPQVLLLLNGVPLRQLFSGSQPNNLRLPVSNIERIEVIRGPGSAIYGADAFAGVINVITYQPDKSNGGEFGLRGGSFDRAGAWVSETLRFGNWGMSLNIEADQSDGDRGRVVSSDLQTTFDGIYGTSVSHAPGPLDTRYDILTSALTLQNPNWRFNIWQYQNEDAGVGPGATQTLDPTGHQDTYLYLFDASYRSDASGFWRWEGQLTHIYGRSQPYFVLFPAGSTLPIGSDGNVTIGGSAVSFPDGLLGNPHVRDKQYNLELRSFYQGWTDHHWRFAIGAQQHELTASSTQNFGPGVIDGTTSPIDGTLTDVTGTSNSFIPDKKRDIAYVSIQDEWQLHPDWALTYGVRADDYSDFGDTVNPRLALVWAMDLDMTSKVLYGRAFRAPSFNELYAQNNPSIQGNSDLKPERINTVEIVFDYHPASDNRISLGLYRYEIQDLIQYVNNTAQNTSGIDGYGFEVEGRWHASRTLLIQSNYTWQSSEYKDTGQPVAEAPEQQLYLDARWQFIPQWHIDLEAYRVFGRERASTDTRADIADYTWVNLTLRHQVKNSGWSVAAGIRNLTDTDAREPSPTPGSISDDYPLEGQSFYLETRYQWTK